MTGPFTPGQHEAAALRREIGELTAQLADERAKVAAAHYAVGYIKASINRVPFTDFHRDGIAEQIDVLAAAINPHPISIDLGAA
jgi:hypothetical protein